MTDVNVTELLARALADRAWGSGREFAEDVRDAMHAALRRPEVLAGIAGVLRRELIAAGGEPGDALHSWRCEYPDVYGSCDCLTETADGQAAAAVEWLTGGAQ